MWLDAYYTPPEVGASIAQLLPWSDIGSCVDTACGTGSLLRAVRERYRGAACFGLDLNGAVVRELRLQHPDWVVSVGDILSARSRGSAQAVRCGRHSDLVVANPPFTGRSFVSFPTKFGGLAACSVAMAHVLTTVEAIAPRKGVMAILPESALYSDLDRSARMWLEDRFDISPLRMLARSTFSGGRANSTVVLFQRRSRRLSGRVSVTHPIARGRGPAMVSLIRGGIPVHLAVSASGGIPFVHTTHLPHLRDGGTWDQQHVVPGKRGVIMGMAVLLPRVGCPRRCDTLPVRLTEPVQLSDCVIALCSADGHTVEMVSRMLDARFDDLRELYKGTGARYVTVDRLSDWLAREGFPASVAKGFPS